MNNLKILNKKERLEIEKQLNSQFGVNEIPGEIIKLGKEKLFLFSGGLNPKNIRNLEKISKIERAGVYFGKEDEKLGGIRLSIEGSQILKSQLRKNLFELNNEQTIEWMKGHELLINTGEKGFLIMKNGEDFLGTGKASAEKFIKYLNFEIKWK